MSSYEQNRARNEYPPQQYSDQNDGAFNPYEVAQPHQSYDQGGYGYQEYRDDAAVPAPPPKEKENSPYVSARTVPARTPRAVRRWRYEHQGNLWTGGSGVRCCGRFFCCTLLIFLFLLVSIVLSLLLWIKPPNVEVGTPTPVSNGSAFQLENDGLNINLQVPISVDNPNYFSVKFSSIDAQIFYPINNTQVGGGNLTNLNIASNKQTNFTLPFSLNYTTDIDPNFSILEDLANKCGFTGNAAQQIKVNYEIKLDFKILFVPIKPTIKNSASFACPLTASDISSLLKSAGINLPDLSTLLKALF